LGRRFSAIVLTILINSFERMEYERKKEKIVDILRNLTVLEENKKTLPKMGVVEFFSKFFLQLNYHMHMTKQQQVYGT